MAGSIWCACLAVSCELCWPVRRCQRDSASQTVRAYIARNTCIQILQYDSLSAPTVAVVLQECVHPGAEQWILCGLHRFRSSAFGPAI